MTYCQTTTYTSDDNNKIKNKYYFYIIQYNDKFKIHSMNINQDLKNNEQKLMYSI